MARRFSATGASRLTAPFAARPDDQLLHVEIRRMQQPAALGRGEHGDGVRRAGGAQVRALQRIDGDVDRRQRAGSRRLRRDADLLTDVEHRRLVALPFADHDGAVDRHAVQVRRIASTAAWSDLWPSP